MYVYIMCVTSNEEYSKVKCCWFSICCVGSVIYLGKIHREYIYLLSVVVIRGHFRVLLK